MKMSSAVHQGKAFAVVVRPPFLVLTGIGSTYYMKHEVQLQKRRNFRLNATGAGPTMRLASVGGQWNSVFRPSEED
jgi:hypothetical protein